MIEKLETHFEKCSPPRPFELMEKINELVEAVNRLENQIEKLKTI